MENKCVFTPFQCIVKTKGALLFRFFLDSKEHVGYNSFPKKQGLITTSLHFSRPDASGKSRE